MVKKIIFSFITVCLFIAIPLALMGFKKVELGAPFLALMRGVNADLENFKIAIPNIPTIKNIAPQVTDGDTVLKVLIALANGLINFVNVISSIINVCLLVFNTVIQVVQVLILIVKNLVVFKDNIAAWQPPIV